MRERERDGLEGHGWMDGWREGEKRHVMCPARHYTWNAHEMRVESGRVETNRIAEK